MVGMKMDMVRPVVWVVIVLSMKRIQMRKKNQVVELTLNSASIVEVAPVTDVIPAYVNHVNQPIQPTQKYLC